MIYFNKKIVASPSFIRSVKSQISEDPNYDTAINYYSKMIYDLQKI
jgi:hypothetical protein